MSGGSGLQRAQQFMILATGLYRAGHLNAVLSSAVMAWVFWWYLRRRGALLDAAQSRAVTAEAARARQAERTAHHAALHDTVLATLTTIAAGRVDANAAPVRERCAREAAYLRRLVQQEEDAPRRRGGADPGATAVTAVGAALEAAVRSAECLGLRVAARYHALPAVPREVAAALEAAVCEALNNVRSHAGTGEAFLTAVGDGDGNLAVTVVDRGAGFDPAAAGGSGGTGLRRSVYARMTAIGGFARVHDTCPDRPRLAPRERQVLLDYASGLTLKATARRARISPNTAKYYLDQVLDG